MGENNLRYYSKDYESFNSDGYLYKLLKDVTLTNHKHSHDFFEIIVFLQGEAVHNVDEELHTIKEMQFVFLKPINVHSFEKQSDSLYVFNLSVLSEKFAKFISAFDFNPIYGKVYTLKNAKIFNEILQLPSVPQNKQKLLINTIIADLLSEVIKNEPLKNNVTPDNLLVAIEKIRKPENISGGVEKLAELAGYSRTHLGRLIKSYYGKTAIELIHDIRMSLALEYLEKTSFTVEKIAEFIGLSSLSQFHSSFKKYYNCTPSTYRKRQQSLNLL